ncbi:MAG TPA: hypothetical protein VMU50_20485 [Polyangia bacterium]|nr:hypothetical protein [Polyangia bacterium]
MNQPAPSPPATAAGYLDAALGWFLRQDRAVLGPVVAQGNFLLHDDVAAARAAVSSGGALSATAFDTLVRFASTMPLLVPAGAPPYNLGDLMTALRWVPPVETAWTWSFQPVPDTGVLEKLEVRKTSRGLAENQRSNRDAWWAHSERNRGFVDDAAHLVESREVAVVLGVGPGSDLPLASIARLYDRLLLVDIDADQLRETADRVFPDPETRARVVLLPMDLTGVNQSLVARIDDIIDGTSRAADAVQAIAGMVRSYRLRAGPQILPPALRADLMVSSCVLSQISWPQRRYASARLAARFGALDAPLAREWSQAWTEFELRVQQDHINALVGHADRVALTCDTVNHKTALDDSGTERVLRADMFFLHSRTLRDRIPQFVLIERGGAWPWGLLKATRKNPHGVRVDVEAYVLRGIVEGGGSAA